MEFPFWLAVSPNFKPNRQVLILRSAAFASQPPGGVRFHTGRFMIRSQFYGLRRLMNGNAQTETPLV